MAITAALLASVLLAPQPNDQWVERLEFPQLVQADLNLNVRDADLGIHGMDLGFPEDPAVRVQEAYAKVEQGDRSSHTLHQAMSGLAQARDGENLRQVVPACLGAYLEELEAEPEDADKRLRFAHALVLAGGIFRDDRLFQDAGLQLAKISQARPDDWRVLDEHAKTLVTRTMLCSRVEGPDPNWLVRATELATKAGDLAPKEVAPRWRRFYAQYIALVQGGTTPEEGLFVSLAELADELTAFGRESGNADLELVGESYWFLCNLTPVTARFEGRELPAPAPSEEVSKRLTVFAERLHSIPEGPLRLDAVRTWYMLAVFLGDLERWEEDLGLAIEMGLPAEEARFLALMGMHKRGAAESAARIAAELALDSEGDMAWRALTVYRHKTGDAAGALAATRNVRSVDRSLRLARAILLLEVHDAEGAQALLVVLAGEVTGTPLAGPVAHAYGVALALGGDKVGAKLQLSVAARILGDEDGAGAKATLAEL